MQHVAFERRDRYLPRYTRDGKMEGSMPGVHGFLA